MAWLHERRVRNYARIIALATFAIWAVYAFLGPRLFLPAGTNTGADYITYYAASRLALDGEPEEAYEVSSLQAAERATRPEANEDHRWSYPPPFLLVVELASVLPYMLSFTLWGTLTTLLYILVLRGLAPVAGITWYALSFGGWFLSVAQGQNGLLSAAILGGGLVLLESRPAVAGALLGAMSYKPHLGLLVPVALLAGREWRALTACAVTAALMAAASLLVFGPDTWAAFIRHSGDALDLLEHGQFKLVKMPTVTAAVLLLGGPMRLAWAVQLAAAAGGVLAVSWLWWAGASLRVRTAGLCSGALLCTPYAYDYDLAILAVAIAAMAMEAREGGLLPWEREGLLLAWALPFAIMPIAVLTNVQVGPLAVAFLLFLVLRRARQERRGEALTVA